MTNEQIKEASLLLDEVDQLERIKLSARDELVLARRVQPSRMMVVYPGGDLERVTGVPYSFAKEVLEGILARKKARLNDIRSAGC